MSRRLSVTVETFDLAADFVISRGSKRQAVVVVATIEDGGTRGRGECVPYQRYGESVESVVAAIEAARSAIEAGAPRDALQTVMPAGAARNAVDCALWDLEAKTGGVPVAERICARPPVPLETAYTISLGTPADMAEAARAAAGRGLLKIKLGGDGDIERIRAVAAATSGARLILDANEAWTPETLRENMLAAAAAGAILVEQPLPAGHDEALATLPHPVPVCADESMHKTGDLAGLVGRYDFVNVKLDKTGGLTEALNLVSEARRLGFGVMVGCMVSSSLAMAPAVLLGQGADLIDLDGPLLMKADREHGLVYSASTVAPPMPDLWG
ncbi:MULTISPECIES: N-acetyl-D-Glu racemase DgcA [unclassified Aureimonas]|uniref:N-acetyl-D-Glu racemase DgcA n=1 Tax=unclassified Aureimonas TaxID=2615206 RepID=UPI000700D7BC|nr:MULTISPECIES: N-acetyl-D-Glu racemase DgcA [unclassified Aureimonas]KQT57401.1 mandelate racemase [Aureimonas sp. Leaf427]KQT77080.1 mandelate racemase [Aureimonas sp. Leaf460]